jgi:hypothetical protein
VAGHGTPLESPIETRLGPMATAALGFLSRRLLLTMSSSCSSPFGSVAAHARAACLSLSPDSRERILSTLTSTMSQIRAPGANPGNDFSSLEAVSPDVRCDLLLSPPRTAALLLRFCGMSLAAAAIRFSRVHANAISSSAHAAVPGGSRCRQMPALDACWPMLASGVRTVLRCRS